MVGVIELGGQEDLAPWYTGGLDPLTDIRFVRIGSCSVDMPVAEFEGMFDSSLDYTRLGLPCS